MTTRHGTDDQSFTATRAELLDALTHLKADVQDVRVISFGGGTIALNAESMADAIINALADQRRHTIHCHEPYVITAANGTVFLRHRTVPERLRYVAQKLLQDDPGPLGALALMLDMTADELEEWKP